MTITLWYRCGLPHRWLPLGDDGESGHTSTLLYNIKQQWPHPFDTPDGKPMQHPPVFTFGQRSSAATVCQSFIQYNAEKGRAGMKNRQVWRKRCQCLLFLDFLWDRWGDLDLERDFLVDFLGVLERDLLDRLGVRGEGDLETNNVFQLILLSQMQSELQKKRDSGTSTRQMSYLLEDFLLLDRGESLCEVREDVSLEYERSERSDLSERGDDDRPLLLLLRVGLGDPLWRRFLSTAGDKYLSN